MLGKNARSPIQSICFLKAVDVFTEKGVYILALGKIWNGMEWNGLEWNGMDWNGMEWNGLDWNKMEWNGMEFYSIMSS